MSLQQSNVIDSRLAHYYTVAPKRHTVAPKDCTVEDILVHPDNTEVQEKQWTDFTLAAI